MAELSQALQVVLVNEGFYSKDPSDPGGETIYGISRRAWPNWIGWQIVDAAKARPNFPLSLKNDATLLAAVETFYRAEFWKYDELVSQRIATKVLDTCVNLGQTRGMSICQRAAGVNPVDGKYGPLSKGAFNGSPEGELLAEIRNRLAGYYNNLVASRPELGRFLNGWLRRAAQ